MTHKESTFVLLMVLEAESPNSIAQALVRTSVQVASQWESAEQERSHQEIGNQSTVGGVKPSLLLHSLSSFQEQYPPKPQESPPPRSHVFKSPPPPKTATLGTTLPTQEPWLDRSHPVKAMAKSGSKKVDLSSLVLSNLSRQITDTKSVSSLIIPSERKRVGSGTSNFNKIL